MFYENQGRDWFNAPAAVSPEAVSNFVFDKHDLISGSWQAPLTNRLLPVLTGDYPEPEPDPRTALATWLPLVAPCAPTAERPPSE